MYTSAHNFTTTRQTANNYTIVFSPALPSQETDKTNTKWIGGVEIEYMTQLETLIQDIAIVSHRIMHLDIKSDVKFKYIQILNKYAPHMGYSQNEIA